MSELGDDMLAHSYFADDGSAIADMASLFWKNADPAKRCGLEARSDAAGQQVWQYRRSKCASRGLIDVVAHLRLADVNTAEEAQEVLSNVVADAILLEDLAPIIQSLFSE